MELDKNLLTVFGGGQNERKDYSVDPNYKTDEIPVIADQILNDDHREAYEEAYRDACLGMARRYVVDSVVSGY